VHAHVSAPVGAVSVRCVVEGVSMGRVRACGCGERAARGGGGEHGPCMCTWGQPAHCAGCRGAGGGGGEHGPCMRLGVQRERT